jgi:stage III sporulation protein AG
MKGKAKGLFSWGQIKEALGWQKLPIKERKQILSALLLVGVGIGFMLWGGILQSSPPTPSPELPVKGLTLLESAEEHWSESRLEREVAAVLSQIEGVGRVVVDLHLATTEETIWLYREERQERVNPSEQGGESRELTIRREPVLRRKSGGEEAPVHSGKKAPVIGGVLVVAEGATDPALQRQLGEAAAVLLGVALHRVVVLPWG